MTLPRFLLITGILLGSTFCVLAFGNPQWKWCYVVQHHVLDLGISHPTDFGPTFPVHESDLKTSTFTGGWNHWTASGKLWTTTVVKDGELMYLIWYERGKPYFINGYGDLPSVLYDPKSGIDRREEFGIRVQ